MGKVNKKMQSRQNNAKLFWLEKTITLVSVVNQRVTPLMFKVIKLLGYEAGF
jgi:hypothetical protein